MNTYKYTIDGKEYAVTVGEVVENTVSVNVNGVDYSVEMEPEAVQEKKTVLQPATQTEQQEAGAAADSANVDTSNALRAPLPGVITEIKVSVGDAVKAGDTLIVLEAMKMANNLEAEKDGVVTAICVKQGESVMEDTPLVVVS